MRRIEVFPVAPLRQGVWLWLWAPLPLAMAAVVGSMVMGQSDRVPRSFLLMALFIAVVGAVLTWTMRRRSIQLDNRELLIAATLYKRRLAVEAIDLERARVMSLDEHTEFKPRLKTNGFNLPGFYAGHFRLRNLTKAFCLITDRTRVLSLPLRDGGLILLSPEKPRALLDRLRELADVPRHR